MWNVECGAGCLQARGMLPLPPSSFWYFQRLLEKVTADSPARDVCRQRPNLSLRLQLHYTTLHYTTLYYFGQAIIFSSEYAYLRWEDVTNSQRSDRPDISDLFPLFPLFSSFLFLCLLRILRLIFSYLFLSFFMDDHFRVSEGQRYLRDSLSISQKD